MAIPKIEVSYGRPQSHKGCVNRRTAVLTYVDFYPGEGPGWALVYRDPVRAEVCDHYLGGTLIEVDGALERARALLRLVHGDQLH